MSFLLKGVIRLYQLLVSPMLGPACRYEPTCSVYAHEAIERHGSLRGSWMAVRRLGRCRPDSAGGYDPVPEHADSGAASAAGSGVDDSDSAAVEPPAIAR